jgi:formylmethanofuran dehydrogenase subunit C
MSGGTIIVDRAAGDWLGAEMRGGTIEVRGQAGNCVGAAYRGSRQGMSGGTIILRRGAGDELGLLMRRGLIAAEGQVGEYAGASMIAGSLFLLGGVGERLGAGMKRGTIVVAAGDPPLGPGFHFACEYRSSFLEVYFRYLDRLQLSAAARPPIGNARCFRGDLVTGGRGEVFSLATK